MLTEPLIHVLNVPSVPAGLAPREPLRHGCDGRLPVLLLALLQVLLLL